MELKDLGYILSTWPKTGGHGTTWDREMILRTWSWTEGDGLALLEIELDEIGLGEGHALLYPGEPALVGVGLVSRRRREHGVIHALFIGIPTNILTSSRQKFWIKFYFLFPVNLHSIIKPLIKSKSTRQQL